MEDTSKRLIPAWVWTILALAGVGLAAAFALSDRRPEPGRSLEYDVSGYERVDASRVCFHEVARQALKLEAPCALCAGADGRVFVAGRDAVVALDRDGNETARYAVPGTPECLASGADGRLYVGMQRYILVLDGQGKEMSRWQDLGGRAWLTSLAAGEDYVYAADAGNRVVLVFDHAGTITGRIGERDPETGAPGFVVPSPYFDVMLDASGALWVVNPGKHGIEHYRPDGTLVSAWYKPGMGLEEFSGCCNPVHAAIRSDGSLVTMEKGLNRVKLYAPDRSLAGVVASSSGLSLSAAAGQSCEEDCPVKDLAVDSDGRVLLLHGKRNELIVFEQNGGSA